MDWAPFFHAEALQPFQKTRRLRKIVRFTGLFLIGCKPAAVQSFAVQAARVLIDGPSDLVFDYGLPEGCGAKPGCRVQVPLRNRPATGTVLSVGPPPDGDFALREISSLVDPEPLITPKLMEMASWISTYYAAPLEQVIRVFLPTSVRQDRHAEKTRKVVCLVKALAEDELESLSRRAPRQHMILSLLEKAGGSLPLKELGEGAASPVKGLEKKGVIALKDEMVRRDPEGETEFLESTPLDLNPEQAIALDAIISSIDSAEKRKPILLHGVTGSGKTEVYLQAVSHCLKKGKTAIVLVPEIALTPQTIHRFKCRFASVQDQVAVLHSHLSQGERFDEWHRIRKGEARIVIGARSGIFAPLPDLGLIIVDAEHEGSYKQDSAPRYHGRDLAVLRASMENCTVLLGSATPSLETWKNSNSGKYQLIELKKRADGQTLPLIRIVDMRLEKGRQKGAVSVLSEKLRAAMEAKLEKGEQIILFLNRRGFARSLQCPGCGKPVECLHCALPLTYHRAEERLICHMCGHQAIVPRSCPSCKDPAIHLQGYGTEKVESVLRKVFPEARVARIDADAMRKKNALKTTLNQFKARKIDIIIGTQMIAKGLHFPNVTLVGVLNADLSLHIPDFRAGERTFQLLTQVAGRAGRGEMEGEVVIQTFTPHSPSVQFARHHDFEGFAEQDLAFRQSLAYPPFSHICMLGTRSSHERRAQFTLETLHRRLKENASPDVVVGEPLPSPLVRSHGQFRFQLMLRSPRAKSITTLIHNTLLKLSTPEDVHIIIDVDAFDLG